MYSCQLVELVGLASRVISMGDIGFNSQLVILFKNTTKLLHFPGIFETHILHGHTNPSSDCLAQRLGMSPPRGHTSCDGFGRCDEF